MANAHDSSAASLLGDISNGIRALIKNKQKEREEISRSIARLEADFGKAADEYDKVREQRKREDDRDMHVSAQLPIRGLFLTTALCPLHALFSRSVSDPDGTYNNAQSKKKFEKADKEADVAKQTFLKVIFTSHPCPQLYLCSIRLMPFTLLLSFHCQMEESQNVTKKQVEKARQTWAQKAKASEAVQLSLAQV